MQNRHGSWYIYDIWNHYQHVVVDEDWWQMSTPIKISVWYKRDVIVIQIQNPQTLFDMG